MKIIKVLYAWVDAGIALKPRGRTVKHVRKGRRDVSTQVIRWTQRDRETAIGILNAQLSVTHSWAC